MPDSIRDGKGKGTLAAVNDENRILTSTVSTNLRTHVSTIHGQSYTMSTGALTLSAADTWHWVLYWKNTSTTKNFHVTTIGVDWNGGSTNFNRPLQVRNLIATAGAPTANHTAVTMSNNNKTSNNAAELTVYKWDEVAAGMTNAAGNAGGDTFHCQGHSQLDFKGFVIQGLNEFVGIQVQSPEVGVFSLGLGGFYLEKGAEI